MSVSLTDKLQKVLHSGLEKGYLDGANVLVLQHGRELAYAEEGYANRLTGSRIGRDTIFRMYSQSKPVTSAAVMLLMERGEIDLFAPVREFLPGFASPKVWEGGRLVPAKTEPTVFNLLSMTAGLAYPDDTTPTGRETAALFAENDALMDQGRGMSTVELANRLGGLPLAFHPGEGFLYSTCADVAGAIVEVVSGMRFGEFLQKELFAPLGMKDTAFYVPEEKAGRLAASCHRRAGLPNEVWAGRYLCCEVTHRSPAFESGGAGLYSTVDDYAAFAQMLLNRGSLNGVRILSPKTVEYMCSPQLIGRQFDDFQASWPTQTGFSYGKFMRVCVNPGQSIGLAREGECGWGGWLNTEMFLFPREEAAILYMTSVRNDAEDTGMYRRIRNAAIAELD